MISNNRSSALVSRVRRNRLLALGALVLLVGAAALWRAPLTQLLWSVAAPLMHARYGGAGLEAELASTTALLADRDALYQENLDLKARLGRTGVAPVRILGAVLMRPPAIPYDTLVIDAGAEEGVVKGDYVSAGGGALIGTVSEVYAHAARVQLFSAPGEEHQALLRLSAQTGASVPVAIHGQGGGSMVAQAPSGTAVSVGDTALLPGIAGGLVAHVRQVDKTESSFITIYFQLSADIFSLRFVEVWKQTPHDTKTK